MKKLMIIFAVLILSSISLIAQTVPVVDGFQMPFVGTQSQTCEFGVCIV